ncbi:non-specific serine/threonine protein kinase [Malassezia yamatoensis]|uniref:non-specific serine/threonine protein kinase n=1 Tax=Malassezia yamatoensis TaxID=253288 RepID=A0AAJ5YU02_9BASI|nr:non-specific serine/threonine protein kinase [Malassezia yamatoensis]
MAIELRAQDMNGLVRRPGMQLPRIPYTSLPLGPEDLPDLELSNVLLATAIDGSLLGIDRMSGAVLWNLTSSPSEVVSGLLQPLVRSQYGIHHQSLEQLAAEALRNGDSETIRALETGGIYVVEPSSGGDLYVVRIRTEQGEVRPQLEKMPFSLPDLIALSPFSLSSDDTRIFVAEKTTRLVELNVFTGSIGTVFDANEASLHDQPHKHRKFGGARPDDQSENEAIESPWVYIGRTDYTLTVHVRHSPDASQTLHYSVYAPNNADQDMVQLWAQHADRIDHRGILVSPEDETLVCFNLSQIVSSKRDPSNLSMPPTLWSRSVNTSVVNLFDVVFVPPAPSVPAKDSPLLRPIIVPHTPKQLAQIVEQRKGALPKAVPSAYLGMSSGGSLYALGQAHYPLVDMAAPAKATMDGSSSHATSLQPWLGTYSVPNQPPTHSIPLLDAPSQESRPLLNAPTVQSSVLAWSISSPMLLALRSLGLALVIFVVVRGYRMIREDRSPVILNTDTLRFDAESQALRADQTESIGQGLGTASGQDLVKKNANDSIGITAPSTSDMAPQSISSSTPASPDSRSNADSSKTIPLKDAMLETTGKGSLDDQENSIESQAPLLSTDREESDEEESQPAPSNEEESKQRRRRRRGKRAGAAVLAKQVVAKREEPAIHDRASPQPPLVQTLTGTEIAPSSLQISEEVLGYGSSGTVVFRGTFQGRAVAVKRLLRDFVLMASKEVSLLQSADNHPNVIRYFCQELTPNFLYIALEQCPANLSDLIERPVENAHLTAYFDPRQAFQQITAGLQHLHSLSIVHRDIKPQNILVTLQAHNKLRMLLSDFGLSKRMDGLAQNSFSQTVNQPGGTVGWRAPEVLQGHRCLDPHAENEETSRLTKAVDIFSLGCVAFYMLTAGRHPFGTQYEREMHILQNQPDLSPLETDQEDTVEAHALITSMISPLASQRPSAERVACHPFFWSAQRKLSFLQEVSDRLETMDRDPPPLAIELLERNAAEVISVDWRRRFDRVFLEDLGRFRKYDKSSVQDLLRVIRNKKHHFQDMQPQLKKQLSPMPDGFLAYFQRRFPLLFWHVYQTFDSLPMLRIEPIFAPYYQLEESRM